MNGLIQEISAIERKVGDLKTKAGKYDPLSAESLTISLKITDLEIERLQKIREILIGLSMNTPLLKNLLSHFSPNRKKRGGRPKGSKNHKKKEIPILEIDVTPKEREGE